MSRYLSSTTHLVKIGADVVVLDTRGQEYFCLPAAADAVRVGPGGVAFDDPDLADVFAGGGLLADEPNRFPASPPLDLPSRDLGLRVAERVRIVDAVAIFAAWTTMISGYHLARFDRLVAPRRRGSCEGPMRRDGEPGEDLKATVAAFERILPWLPFQGVCLYRSFLLRRVLRWRGHDAHWIFGVRTWPFKAHCWLQVGDVALDDTADRLAGFSIIMVV